MPLQMPGPSYVEKFCYGRHAACPHAWESLSATRSSRKLEGKLLSLATDITSSTACIASIVRAISEAL